MSLAESIPYPAFVIEGGKYEDIEFLFNKIYNALLIEEGEIEPMMNLVCWYDDNKWTLVVITRKIHRRTCYYAEGDEQFLISPGAADMACMVITPLEKDFKALTSEKIDFILKEVCLNNEEIEDVIKRITA